MRVLDFIVCDEIRHEVGDKYIFIGVYPEDMLVHFEAEEKWPYVGRFGFFLKFLPEGEVGYEVCNFKVLRRGEVRSQVPLKLKLGEPSKPFALMLNVFPFAVSEPGNIDFEAEFFGPNKEPLRIPLPSFSVRTGRVGRLPGKPAEATKESPTPS